MTTNEEQLRQKIRELEEQNDQLLEQLRDVREQLARAKDPRPVMRPSFVRVRALAQIALFDLERHPHGGFTLIFGKNKQWYKTLTELWEIFTRESWILSEVMPTRRETIDPNERAYEVPVKDWTHHTSGWFGEISYTKIDFIPCYVMNFKRIPPVKRNRELVKQCRQDYRNREDANPRTPNQNKPLLPKVEWWNDNLVPGY